jgi:hypothetical protein
VPRSALLLLLVSASPSATLAQVTSSTTDPITVVREYIGAQNRGDVDKMLSLLAEQVEIRVGLTNATLATSALSENQAQLRTRFTRIVQNFPSARSEVLEVISEGSVVMTKERTTGLPGDCTDTGLAMYKVRNGRIEAMWVVSSSGASGDR